MSKFDTLAASAADLPAKSLSGSSLTVRILTIAVTLPANYLAHLRKVYQTQFHALMAAESSLVIIAGRFALVVLLISIIVAFARLIKGPDAADRIVALDLISMLIVAFLAAESIYAGETSFLDVAIAYALIA